MPSNTSRAFIAKRKRTRAVQLRAMGRSFDAIAQALLPCDDHKPEGRHDCQVCQPMYSHRSSAKRAVDAALEEDYGATAETREQLRRHHLSQVDLLLSRAMREAMGTGDGHHEAGRLVVRLLDRRAKLLGLDAPSRVQVTTEMDREIDELLEALDALPAATEREDVS
jgi:hypothetical protein